MGLFFPDLSEYRREALSSINLRRPEDARSFLARSIKSVMVCPTIGQMDAPFLIVLLPRVGPGPLLP
jgi:hypothetical protein